MNDNPDLQMMIERQTLDPEYEFVDLRLNRTSGYIKRSILDFGDNSKYYIVITEDGKKEIDEGGYNRLTVDLGIRLCVLAGGFKALHDTML